MFHRHRSGIGSWSTGECFPKARDDFQVTFPVFDLGLKYRTDQGILTHVGIEMP